MTDIPPRPRRTPEEIADEKRAKIQRAEDRARRRVERNSERSAQAAQGYEAEKERERERERQRQWQEDGLDYIAGRDTPGARRFAEEVAIRQARVIAANRAARIAGDPANITGHTQRPPAKHFRKLEEKLRRESGTVRQIVTAEDGERAVVTALPHSLRGRTMSIVEQQAALRFQTDYFAAEADLKSPDWDVKVDVSHHHKDHFNRLDAQTRMKTLKASVGERNWDIIVKVVICGWSARTFHEHGARDHRSVNSDIDVAIKAVTDFYYPGQADRDPTWKAARSA